MCCSVTKRRTFVLAPAPTRLVGTKSKHGDLFFMANHRELEKQRAFALDKADGIIRVAENAGRQLTEAEQLEIDSSMAAVNALTPQINERKRLSTMQQFF